MFLAAHPVNKTISYKAYSSFTKMGELYNPDASVTLYVESEKGKDISMFNESEKEVLYRRNSRFKVEEIERINGRYCILLKEV